VDNAVLSPDLRAGINTHVLGDPVRRLETDTADSSNLSDCSPMISIPWVDCTKRCKAQCQ